MGRKCSVFNCTSGFKTSKFKGHIFGFPSDADEKLTWVNALPNKLNVSEITCNYGVCELHWPQNYPTKPLNRWQVPVKPPSIFQEVESSCCQQTATKKSRDINVRNVSQSARAENKHLMENALDVDIIQSWETFLERCQELQLPILKNDAGIMLLGMSTESPPALLYTIGISSDFKVTCFKQSSNIPIRNIINSYTVKLERYSQLNDVIAYVASVDPLLEVELRSHAGLLQQLSFHDDVNDEQKRRLDFLSSQVLLTSYKSNGRRYTTSDIKVAIDIFLRSRSCYSALRKTVILPHPNTIKNLFGKLESPGSINECNETVRAVFSQLDRQQRYCKILVDEVHIKPAIRYQGNHVIGFAIDEPKPAKTVLALMVCPILGGPAFVARLLPVYSLNNELLFDQINMLIRIIHESLGFVFLVMTDNLSANVACFDKFHKKFGSLNEFSVNHPIENDIFASLFLLFDPIHLFKNIKNNWLTEKMKKLIFEDFESNESLVAEWKDIINIYKSEKDSINKRTKLNYSTVYPTNFDKQKVQLTLNVFNEKTVAVLTENKQTGTATFVKLVTRLINILNVKSPKSGDRLNDKDRDVFSTVDDNRFQFLENMASMFAKMDTSLTIYPTRIMCLTSQTSKALSLTIKGLIAIIKMFLGKGIKYVMTGNFQSDRLEGEFGIYRQLNGGNYYMSAEHVQNCLKLQRIKLFSRLNYFIKLDHTENSCCKEPLNENEIDQLDNCFSEASDLNETERSTLYYISGYVCHKENLQSAPPPSLELPASEFTNNVSRGKLSHPPMELYDLSLYLFSYYKSLDDKTCIKKVMMAFQHIYEASQCDFQNITSILRRFLNTFSKGYVTRETENIKRAKRNKNSDVKRRRLQHE